MVSFEIDKQFLILRFDRKLLDSFVQTLLEEEGFSFEPYNNTMVRKITESLNINALKQFLISQGYDVEDSEEIRDLEQEIHKESELFEKIQNNKELLKNGDFKLPQIPRFVITLYPFQRRSVFHIIFSGNAANFSVTGSGKTILVYASYSYWKSNDEIDKLLIIGPRNCFISWKEEYRTCFGEEINIARLVGPKRQEMYDSIDDYDIFQITYDTCVNDKRKIIKLLSKYRFLVVLDESHYIKRFKEGIKAETVITIAPYATKRLILTGTPMPQGYEDLYSQFSFLWPRIIKDKVLGNKAVYQGLLKNRMHTEEIKERIDPLFIRIKKNELNLPLQNFIPIQIDLSPIQEMVYNTIKGRTLEYIQNLNLAQKGRLNEWRKWRVVYLREAASNPGLLLKNLENQEDFELTEDLDSAGEMNLMDKIRHYPSIERPEKIKKAIEITKRIVESGQNVIVWCYFIGNLKLISNILTNEEHIKNFIVYGATEIGEMSDDEEDSLELTREAIYRRFRESKESCVLIANPYACGESVSLHQNCHNAIYVDRDYNCGRYLQSLDRIHRVGLENNVITNYYILMSTNTIDERIHKRLQKKASKMYDLLNDELPLGFFGFEDDEEAITDDDNAELLDDL